MTIVRPLLEKLHQECGAAAGVSCVRAAESSPRSSSVDPAEQPAGQLTARLGSRLCTRQQTSD